MQRIVLLILSVVVNFAQPQTTVVETEETVTNPDPYLVVSTFNSILRINPWPFKTTPQSMELVSSLSGGIDAVEYHLRLGLLFWTNTEDGVIRSANLDGSNIRTLITGIGRPGDLTVDWLNDRIYWTDWLSRTIEEYDLNTELRRVVTNTGQGSRPTSITIYPFPNAGWLYWADTLAESIKRVSVTGDDETVVVPFLINACLGPLALDYTEQTVFWIDNCDFTIRSVNVSNGVFSSNEPIHREQVSALGLTVFQNILYWTETDSVYGVNRSNTNAIQLVEAGSRSNPFQSLRMVHPDNQPDEETYIERVLGNNSTTPVCEEQCINGVCIPPGLCACERGWSGTNCTTDVNECLILNGGCESACVNIIGSYYCSCGGLVGYTLDENGRNCTDVNECEIFNGGCEQNCSNSEGSFECSCEDDYILDDNQFNCTRIMPTSSTELPSVSSTEEFSTTMEYELDLSISMTSFAVTSSLSEAESSVMSIGGVGLATTSVLGSSSIDAELSTSAIISSVSSVVIPEASSSVPATSSPSPSTIPNPSASDSTSISTSDSIPSPSTSNSIQAATTSSVSMHSTSTPVHPTPVAIEDGAISTSSSHKASVESTSHSIASSVSVYQTPQTTPGDGSLGNDMSNIPLVVVVGASVAGGTALIVIAVLAVVIVFGGYMRSRQGSYSFDKEKGKKSKEGRDSVNSKTSFGLGSTHSGSPCSET